MSVGRLLLNPGALTAADSDQALIEDLLAAIAAVVEDVAQGGTILGDLEAAFSYFATRQRRFGLTSEQVASNPMPTTAEIPLCARRSRAEFDRIRHACAPALRAH